MKRTSSVINLSTKSQSPSANLAVIDANALSISQRLMC
jgi:hypothetical protein